MKKKTISNLKWHSLITFLLFGIQIGCKPDTRCEILERYSNDKPKLEMCILNERDKIYQYKEFYDNGNIETLFYLINEKLEGEVTAYYQTGGIKSKSMYKSGKKEGNYFEFHEDGRLDYYNYFVKDQVVYIKDYQYGLNDSIKFEEGFIPILSFEQNSDTIFCKERLLNFDISIPLPDSILKGKNLIYEFGIKPISLKDSLIFDSSSKVVLDNKRVINCTVKLKSSTTQIFYGYIINKKDNHLYQPFEKPIVLVK